MRPRLRLRWPITLNVTLMLLNVALMVIWIVLFAKFKSWSGLTIGTVAFSLIIIGLLFYLFLTIKESRLNQRQVNFIDSVTHELKTPIAAVRLYLETLRMRELDDARRHEFYEIMQSELDRLDHLISQLLEVARLDHLGTGIASEEVHVDRMLRRCAAAACGRHELELDQTVQFELTECMMYARPLVLEMIFGNLLDNAVKYAGDPPQVRIAVGNGGKGRLTVRVGDNGPGVPEDQQKRIFRLFYRGGSELERRRKGTGLGLYIVRTLVRNLGGDVSVRNRPEGGSEFTLVLPRGAAK